MRMVIQCNDPTSSLLMVKCFYSQEDEFSKNQIRPTVQIEAPVDLDTKVSEPNSKSIAEELEEKVTAEVVVPPPKISKEETMAMQKKGIMSELTQVLTFGVAVVTGGLYFCFKQLFELFQ